MVVGMSSVLFGVVGYNFGASLGTVFWTAINRKIIPTMDKMDRVFFRKINHYRAERGQSPYTSTITGTGTVLKSVIKQDKNVSGKWRENTQDFYGERIQSVQDYRQWLRKQVKWNRQHLGKNAPSIRGIPN